MPRVQWLVVPKLRESLVASRRTKRRSATKRMEEGAVTFEQVRKMALKMDGVEDAKSYGTAAFKVRGNLMARLKEDGETLVLATTFEEREGLMAEEAETYFITDHYLNYPWVLVRLKRVKAEAMRELLARAWRLARETKNKSTKAGRNLKG